jgi:hypothetical protein
MNSIRQRLFGVEAQALDFAPAIMQAQHAPPAPFIGATSQRQSFGRVETHLNRIH